MAGEIEYLNTSGFVKAQTEIKNATLKFIMLKKDMQKATSTLLSTWEGKGRGEFQVQVDRMMSRLEDISEDLTELYNALVDAEKAYIDADEQAAKSISMNG